MSNKKQDKIKEARNSLELSSIETAIDCPIGPNTSLTENKESSTLTTTTPKPKDAHDETDFLAAACSLSGLHAAIETLASTTDLLLKLEKHLGIGKITNGTIEEKNKKQEHSLLFPQIWNIIKIIVWLICAYIIIRTFLISGDSRTIQDSKIVGEKSDVINNNPFVPFPSTPAAFQPPVQRNDSKDLETLLKLTLSLKSLLTSLKLATDVELPVVKIEEVENLNKIKILKPVSNRNITKRNGTNHSITTSESDKSNSRPSESKITESLHSFATDAFLPPSNSSSTTTTTSIMEEEHSSNISDRGEQMLKNRERNFTTQFFTRILNENGNEQEPDAQRDNVNFESVNEKTSKKQQHEFTKVEVIDQFLNLLAATQDFSYKNQSENTSVLEVTDLSDNLTLEVSTNPY